MSVFGRRGPVSFRAVKGKGFESALEFGGGGRCRGGGGGRLFESALGLVGVVVACCLFLGGRGPVSFRAVKGKAGQSALELCSSSASSGLVLRRGRCRRRRAVCFCFWGAGGQSASGVCCFCGEWRRVSFRGWEMIMKGMGSESASGGAMEKGLMSSSFEGGHSGLKGEGCE